MDNDKQAEKEWILNRMKYVTDEMAKKSNIGAWIRSEIILLLQRIEKYLKDEEK